MTTRERILAAVFRAVTETNRQLAPDRRLAASERQPLAGTGCRLDSLGLVNLVVAVETAVEGEFGQPVPLTDALASALDPGGPFATVGALADHLERLVAEGARP